MSNPAYITDEAVYYSDTTTPAALLMPGNPAWLMPYEVLDQRSRDDLDALVTSNGGVLPLPDEDFARAFLLPNGANWFETYRGSFAYVDQSSLPTYDEAHSGGGGGGGGSVTPPLVFNNGAETMTLGAASMVIDSDYRTIDVNKDYITVGVKNGVLSYIGPGQMVIANQNSQLNIVLSESGLSFTAGDGSVFNYPADGVGLIQALPVSLPLACSDEVTPFVANVSTPILTFHMPFDMNVTGAFAGLNAADGTADIGIRIIDANDVSLLETGLVIPTGSPLSYDSTNSVPILVPKTMQVRVFVDQIGDGFAAGLKIYLEGTRSA